MSTTEAVPGNVPVGPTFVTIFLVIVVLIAIVMAVFFQDRRE